MTKHRWIAFVLALALLNAAGCANVQKKFTRKKKEPARIPAVMYVEQGPYQKPYSNDYYYRTHYTMWRTWHDELIDQLGGNNKKVSRCAEESYNHLSQLAEYLLPEKKAALEPILKDLERVTRRIRSGGYAASEEPSMRSDLERIGRLVANDFYYNKVKDQVLPDQVALNDDPGDPAPEDAAPAS